jgi:hypothetical protein
MGEIPHDGRAVGNWVRHSARTFDFSEHAVTPNPSLHPTCYSGLRPLAQAGELERYECPVLLQPGHNL